MSVVFGVGRRGPPDPGGGAFDVDAATSDSLRAQQNNDLAQCAVVGHDDTVVQAEWHECWIVRVLLANEEVINTVDDGLEGHREEEWAEGVPFCVPCKLFRVKEASVQRFGLTPLP